MLLCKVTETVTTESCEVNNSAPDSCAVQAICIYTSMNTIRNYYLCNVLCEIAVNYMEGLGQKKVAITWLHNLQAVRDNFFKKIS